MNAYILIWLATVGALFPYAAVAGLDWIGRKKTRSPETGDAT